MLRYIGLSDGLRRGRIVLVDTANSYLLNRLDWFRLLLGQIPDSGVGSLDERENSAVGIWTNYYPPI